MRVRRAIRRLRGMRISGNNYLAVGGFFAALAVAIPVAGPTLAPVIVAAAALLAGIFIITIIGILVGPVVL